MGHWIVSIKEEIPACFLLGTTSTLQFVFILNTCPQRQQRDRPFPRGFIHTRAWQRSSSRPAALLHDALRNSCCFTGQLMSWPFPYTFVLFAKNTTVPFNSRALLGGGAPCTSPHAVAGGAGQAKRTAQYVLWWPAAQGWMKVKGSSPPWLFFPSFYYVALIDSSWHYL